MVERKFSVWTRWKDRNAINGIKFPGIYCIAISETDLFEKRFEWISKISYIGMTNSKAGLKGRLKQFDNTIIGKRGKKKNTSNKLKHKATKVNKMDSTKNWAINCPLSEPNTFLTPTSVALLVALAVDKFI